MNSDRAAVVDLARVKTVGAIIGDALRCYWRYPVLFGGLALAVVLPYSAVVLGVNASGPLGGPPVSASFALLVLLLDLLLLAPLISALHIHALVAIGEGREPAIVEVARRGVRVLATVAAAQIVAAIAIGFGFVLLIIPGVLLMIRFAVVAQAAAVEGVNWVQALRRSGELARRNYLHVLGVIVLVALIDFAIEQAGAAAIGTGTSVSDVLIGIAVVTITRSFAALTTAVLFFDLVARQDGSRTTGV